MSDRVIGIRFVVPDGDNWLPVTPGSWLGRLSKDELYRTPIGRLSLWGVFDHAGTVDAHTKLVAVEQGTYHDLLTASQAASYLMADKRLAEAGLVAYVIADQVGRVAYGQVVLPAKPLVVPR
jgi:hypothetical protein